MKMPSIEIADQVVGDQPTILRSSLPGEHDIEVLTSYDDVAAGYVSTVHVDTPEGVIKTYSTPARQGLWETHAYIVGVVLACAVLTGVIKAEL